LSPFEPETGKQKNPSKPAESKSIGVINDQNAQQSSVPGDGDGYDFFSARIAAFMAASSSLPRMEVKGVKSGNGSVGEG